MPELPDVELYLHALRPRVIDRVLVGIRVRGPSVLRTWDPPLESVHGKRILALRRLGKRIVWQLEDDLFLVLHLMIAGRLQWREAKALLPGKIGLAAFDLEDATLILTEASSHKRAALYVVRGEAGLADHDPGGREPLECTRDEFVAALTREGHTLKRALTDPRFLSGIGNAYSDEILHRAGLSPFAHTGKVSSGDWTRLFEATRAVLVEWIDRLREQAGSGWPRKVTAFRPEMAVHGRYREPCPVCASPVQRIRYKNNETNYCPGCQTGGRILADRSLSRLLREDWPRTLEELEERFGPR